MVSYGDNCPVIVSLVAILVARVTAGGYKKFVQVLKNLSVV